MFFTPFFDACLEIAKVANSRYSTMFFEGWADPRSIENRAKKLGKSASTGKSPKKPPLGLDFESISDFGSILGSPPGPPWGPKWTPKFTQNRALGLPGAHQGALGLPRGHFEAILGPPGEPGGASRASLGTVLDANLSLFQV